MPTQMGWHGVGSKKPLDPCWRVFVVYYFLLFILYIIICLCILILLYINCRRAKNADDRHAVYSRECPVRRKFDVMARQTTTYCWGRLLCDRLQKTVFQGKYLVAKKTNLQRRNETGNQRKSFAWNVRRISTTNGQKHGLDHYANEHRIMDHRIQSWESWERNRMTKDWDRRMTTSWVS